MDNTRGNVNMVSKACKSLQGKEHKKKWCNSEAVEAMNFSLPHLELAIE